MKVRFFYFGAHVEKKEEELLNDFISSGVRIHHVAQSSSVSAGKFYTTLLTIFYEEKNTATRAS